MPIKSCTLPGGGSGYRWGDHGKCYPERAEAEKQAEAAYANGYRGDYAMDAGTGVAAGVLLERKDGRIFLVKRSGSGDHAGEWALPGGSVERGEEVQGAAARELAEETGIIVHPSTLELLHTDTGGDVDFVTYRHEVTGKEAITLNEESSASGWFERHNLPGPLHPQCARMLTAGAQVRGLLDTNTVAMDKESVRSVDDFGRMHVEMTHISKACVNPYYGKEIPKWQELGLQPERVYYLLRDPVELAKSVPTWNKIPLLITHIGHSADNPVKEYIVGTTGESTVFNPPYLDNSLCLWDNTAIAGVETKKQRELSCSYAYRADMTPGEYEGARYDGVMRDIVGNHVAIVKRARVGSDVLVGDKAMANDWNESDHPRASNGRFEVEAEVEVTRGSYKGHSGTVHRSGNGKLDHTDTTGVTLTHGGRVSIASKALRRKSNNRGGGSADDGDVFARPSETKPMKNAGIIAVRTALGEYLRPALANDAAPIPLRDLVKAGTSPAEVAKSVAAHYSSKFTVNTKELAERLTLARDAAEEMDDEDEEAAEDESEEEREEREEKEREEEAARDERRKARDKRPAAKDRKAKDKKAEDARKAEDERRRKAEDRHAKDNREAGANGPRERAEDADSIRESLRREFRALRQAEDDVRPLVGQLVAMDSAEEVYEAALKQLGVKVEGIHPSAYPALIEAQKQIRGNRRPTPLASDNATVQTVTELFPGARKPGRA